MPTILGELRRYFRDRTWALHVPRQLQELSWRIERVATSSPSRWVASRRSPSSPAPGRRGGALLQALELALGQSTVPLDGPPLPDEEDEPERWPGRLDEGYARVEDRTVLGPLLETLPAGDAQIVALRFCGDLTQDAIAQRVGSSQMHVSRVLYRSLAKLRDAAA